MSSVLVDYRVLRATRILDVQRALCPPPGRPSSYAFFPRPADPDAPSVSTAPLPTTADTSRCADVGSPVHALQEAFCDGLVDGGQFWRLLLHLLRIQWSLGRTPCVGPRPDPSETRAHPVYAELARTHHMHRAEILESRTRGNTA